MKEARLWKKIILPGVFSLISCALYLVYSFKTQGWGFPLDDAWIHHTFARNFAANLTWSFQQNKLSGGSTGPLWGLMLSALYFFKVPPLIGTYFFGFLTLWASAVMGILIVEKVLPDNDLASIGAAALISLEWHLVWGSLSGMETMLLALISLIAFYWLLGDLQRWWIPGALVGLSVWIRPDGLTLFGPVALVLIFDDLDQKTKLKKGLVLIASTFVAGSMYFLFNMVVAGDFWPNTFYAKQAEYKTLYQIPYLIRFINQNIQFVTGVGVLLVPGLVIQFFESMRRRNYPIVAGTLWAVGYIALFAWRLPVVYQHGRYIMPALPIAYLIGLIGLIRVVQKPTENQSLRIINKAWIGSTAIVLGIFLFYGGRAYGLDVAIINSEMVSTAKWIDANLEEDAVIAAHDIGALGYFSQRRIIDLAGLITPDVIPFIRDEDQLRSYLENEKPDYLVTFPSWYLELTSGLEMINSTKSEFSAKFGHDNMAVYIWD